MLDYIKILLQEREAASAVFKRNLVKEYLSEIAGVCKKDKPIKH